LEQQPKKNTYLALLGAAHSFNHSLFVIAPPLLTLIMSDLHVSKFVIGTVATVASFIYGVGALVGGPLGDKIGEVKTITICLFFSGLSTFIMLAAGFTMSIYVYALALVLMSSWASLYHPTANSLISKAFKGRVAEAMGLHGVGGTLGVVLTPTIAWFIGATFGWPWAFVTFGALCMLLALLFIKTQPSTPRKQSRNKTELAGYAVLSAVCFISALVQNALWAFPGAVFFILALWQSVPRSQKTEGKNNNKTGTIIDALKIRELWILLMFNIAIGLFMKGVELFFPTYLKENRQIDPMWASVAYTMILAAGVLGQWIGGKAADKVGSKKVLIATSTGVCLSLISLLFVPIYSVGIIAFILLYGLSFYAHQPALNSLTGFLSPQNQRGAVYGIFFFTSFGIGSLSQFVSGYAADVYGLDTAFYLLTIFALIALLLSFKLPKKKESDEEGKT